MIDTMNVNHDTLFLFRFESCDSRVRFFRYMPTSDSDAMNLND